MYYSGHVLNKYYVNDNSDKVFYCKKIKHNKHNTRIKYKIDSLLEYISIHQEKYCIDEVIIIENDDVADYTNKIMNLVDEFAIENLLWTLIKVQLIIKGILDE